LVTFFKEAWDGIVQTFNETLKPALENLWETLKPLEPFFTLMAKILGGILLTALLLVTKAIEGVVRVITALLALGAEVTSFIVTHFTKPILAFTDAVKSAYDWVVRLINKMASVSGGAIGKVKSILGFEHGGTVPGAIGTPVPIIAHGGETIIPASRNAGSTGGGTNITLNLNYPQFTNQESVEIVRSQIENALRDVVRIYKLQPTS